MRRLLPALFAACAMLAAGTPRPARAADAVTEWTMLADQLGRGGANWHTLAIMQQAMHDALNAALPIYQRWAPAEADEPDPAGALPQVAMAAAAARVLSDLHPDQRAVAASLLRTALRRVQGGSPVQAGLALGDAVGAAAVRRRAEDGYRVVLPFPVATAPGKWRHDPPEYKGSNTTRTRPFLLTSPNMAPPPALGSAAYVQGVETTRRTGGAETTGRTEDQTVAAMFWAYQSSQRGFVHLAVTLLDQRPLPGGVFAHARLMSQLAAALADSAVVIWQEKEVFSAWRPVTAIRLGGYGVTPDPAWEPLIETPPHPEYPSGHASDCFTGAGVLAAALGRVPGPIQYFGNLGNPLAEAAQVGMGQHAQVAPAGVPLKREFPSLAAAAEECAASRIWSGAHFPAADAEARRVAGLITQRALAAVPLLR